MSEDPHGVTATVAELACELDDAKKRSERLRGLLFLSATLAYLSVILLAGVTDVSSFSAGEIIFLSSLFVLTGLVSRVTWGFGLQSASFAFKRPVVDRPKDDRLRRDVADAYKKADAGWQERKARSTLEIWAFFMSFGLILLCAAAVLSSRSPEALSTTSLALSVAFAAFSATSAFIAGRDTVSRHFESAGEKILGKIFEWGETQDVTAAAKGRRSAPAIPRSASVYLASLDATLAGMRRGRRQRPLAAA